MPSTSPSRTMASAPSRKFISTPSARLSSTASSLPMLSPNISSTSPPRRLSSMSCPCSVVSPWTKRSPSRRHFPQPSCTSSGGSSPIARSSPMILGPKRLSRHLLPQSLFLFRPLPQFLELCY
ncbi:hypothetical protein CPB84DRAFT_1776415 [Gymnopilus junonius]|uniref:Uncharacterized protein n=1 Tax=Gymnopilus junonius TaxID=109634 RepID=A0A9P5TNR7_GYMJU|nr:hypothetical protein CPB84DRAFT_1776415 [Gymnopilus junonius]